MKINRTTQRAIDMLKLISKHPDGITLEEILIKLNLPKTSAYDIVVTLVHNGMVEMKKEARVKYYIGLTAYRIGMNYTNNIDINNIMDNMLKPFSKEIGKTVFYGIRSGDSIIYISKYEPENPIITTATIGSKNPVHCTSLGKAILAFMDESEREAIISSIKYERKTKNSIMSADELYRKLDIYKKRGYAFDERELEEHMQCVGAPIFNENKEVIGAISASSLYRVDEDYNKLGEKIAKKAKEISGLLGYEA